MAQNLERLPDFVDSEVSQGRRAECLNKNEIESRIELESADVDST